jgi:rfaE bifunctional protein nucleotidyltransferase chain/domain
MFDLSIVNKKLLHFENCEPLFSSMRLDGKTIGLCHGVFDLLHPGHLRHFAKAKELVDILVVSITADQFVNKGPGRPAFSQQLRSEALANLISVDFVVVTPYSTAVEVISSIKPTFYIKGNDYAQEKSDATGNISIEKQTIEKFGGQIVFTEEIVFSSSELINKFLPTYSSEITDWLEEIRSKFGVSEILNWLNEISKLKVTVIGETILDVYTECEALGKSAKDPVLCFNRGSSRTFLGGSLAIGAHCNGLGLDTTVITGINHKDLSLGEFERLKQKGIKISAVDTSPRPTIRKERFIDSRTSYRVLEIYEMDDSPLPEVIDKQFKELILDNLVNSDIVIVADYGHGLISDKAIQVISSSSKFLAVNAQANAGNRGFNSVSRYKHGDFITLNGSEAQLEMRRKHFEIDDFVLDLFENSKSKQILITKGSEGLVVYRKPNLRFPAPALAPFVKDRVGAGDALLSITSLLSCVGAPEEIIGFYGNLVGAWAVSFLGNEKSLLKGDLIRQVTSILK